MSILFLSPCYAGEVYRYKDSSGKWVFTDAKPDDSNFKTVQIKDKKKKAIEPKLYIDSHEQDPVLMVENPFYVSIQVLVAIEGKAKPYLSVVPELATLDIVKLSSSNIHYQYRWILGDPNSKHTATHYLFPVSTSGQYKITQGFGGRFSHTSEPNVNALDIAMPIGTELIAAREGTVIGVKDDYHMAGDTNYFLDKANYIKILHEDGTYAVYAHILLGSALVQPGDHVKTGDKIARSGSSGFSTGPHLHFVVRKNAFMKSISVPFKMVDLAGRAIKLQKGEVASAWTQ